MIFFAEREKFRGKASTFLANIPQSEGKMYMAQRCLTPLCHDFGNAVIIQIKKS